MQILGIRLTIFAALIAAFGAATGLALSGTLQNFASGILILILKPFKPGDNIVAQNIEGTVTTIQIFYTIVTTFDNRSVIMPNSKLSNEVITNISREGRRRLDIELKFNFSVDFREIKELIKETLKAVDNVLTDPPPRVGISTLETDGYKCFINIWVHAHGFQDTKLRVNEKLLNVYMAKNVKMAPS
jgi:small conductance mechanosensitive channel